MQLSMWVGLQHHRLCTDCTGCIPRPLSDYRRLRLNRERLTHQTKRQKDKKTKRLFLSSPRALSARGLLLAEGPPHWGGGKESESWSHEKSMLAVLVQILLKSCFENGKLWETKKVSAREKTKQPIAGPVLMSFCSTNWN